MKVHKSEQPIVDILSQILPFDVVQYEILPRYRLPTDEEVEQGKRLFNRCLVELMVIEHGCAVMQQKRHAKIPYSWTTEFYMISHGLGDEMLQTLKPSEVMAFTDASLDAIMKRVELLRGIRGTCARI